MNVKRLKSHFVIKKCQKYFKVPDYTTVVTEPMDLSTMRKKLDEGQYPDLTAMEKDFDLMIANCLAYNNRDTVFYRYVNIINQIFLLFHGQFQDECVCFLDMLNFFPLCVYC